jgi:hypothetical protein
LDADPPAQGAHCLTRNVTEQVPANDWGNDTESGRCRRWREGSAWARGARWCRRWRSASCRPSGGRRGASSSNRSVQHPTGMPPQSAAPATLPSGAGSPRTKATVVDRGQGREMQTGTRTGWSAASEEAQSTRAGVTKFNCPICGSGVVEAEFGPFWYLNFRKTAFRPHVQRSHHHVL